MSGSSRTGYVGFVPRRFNLLLKICSSGLAKQWVTGTNPAESAAGQNEGKVRLWGTCKVDGNSPDILMD